MPEFRYSAIDIKGNKINGMKNAKDKTALKSELLENGEFLLDILDNNSYDLLDNDAKASNNKSSFELSELFSLLKALLASGVPLFKSLSIIMKNDLPSNLNNVFIYSYIDASGHKKIDIMNVKDKATLKSELLKKNEFLLDSSDNISKNIYHKKLSLFELSEFCRELSAMLSSGIPLVKSINIIMNRDLSKNLKNVFSDLNVCIRRGASLSEAMEQQNNIFPEIMINMIKAGEEAGNLDETTEKLAVMFQKEHRLKMSVKSALAYPLFLLIITVLILIFIFTFVMPKFVKLFDNIELPSTTKFILSIGDLFSNYYMELIFIIALLAASAAYMMNNKKCRYFLDKHVLRIPAVGKLLSIIYTARFANTLSSMYSSGIPLVNAVNISASTVGNMYIFNQVTEAAKKIRSGVTLSSSISKIDGFDKKLTSSIAVGEESGKIDTLLSSLSDSYDYEASVALSKLVSFIEPVFIIIMGGFVAFVVISVMQAVYSLYSNVH